MAYFGVDGQIRIDELNLQFKNQLRNKGGVGLRALTGIFRKFDLSHNGRLDALEFEMALGELG